MAITRGKSALAAGLAVQVLLASCGDPDSPEPVRPTPPIPQHAPITHVSSEEPPPVFPGRWERASQVPDCLGVAVCRRLPPQIEPIEIPSSAEGSR